MATYIDREALYRDIESSVVFSARNAPRAEMRGANKIMDRIKHAPAADVAPVVHGRLHDNYQIDEFHYIRVCSVCDKRNVYHKYDSLGHYCPNCGAKMDVTDINVGSKENKMKIIKASVEFMEPVNGAEILRHLERCGRVCYKSEGKIEDGSAEKFLRNVIKRGHEAVLEHKSITVKFICDRGVSHEIVRHRVASYCQESTRYCDYGGEGIVVIEPCYLDKGGVTYKYWEWGCRDAELEYNRMRCDGCSPQEARAVLPNSLKTEVVMTANIREWRHFLRLRCSKAAHPQMREVAIPLLQLFYDEMPVLFEDVYAEVHGNEQ